MASPGLSLVAFQIICWFGFFGKEGEVASAETGMEAGTYFLVMVTVLASLALAGNGSRKSIVFSGSVDYTFMLFISPLFLYEV